LIVPLSRANQARAAKSKCGPDEGSTGGGTCAAGTGATAWVTDAPDAAGVAALDWASTAAMSVRAVGSTVQG
jgi:hypothetical protein